VISTEIEDILENPVKENLKNLVDSEIPYSKLIEGYMKISIFGLLDNSLSGPKEDNFMDESTDKNVPLQNQFCLALLNILVHTKGPISLGLIFLVFGVILNS
jgi:hypothetical protein